MSTPIIVERIINAPMDKAWSALTELDELRQWYFPLDEFKAVVGFKFQFLAGASPGEEWLHLCEIVDVVPGRKIAYTWRYGSEPGNSVVSFELFGHGDKTILRITHTGTESFEPAGPNFSRESFTGGWTHFAKLFKTYLEPSATQDFTTSISVNTSAQHITDVLTLHISNWWTANFEGSGKALNDTFTVHFGKTFKTMLVEELVPGKKVVWFCRNAYIDVDQFPNKKEWIGTRIIWEVDGSADAQTLTLTHTGLNSDLDCYDICVDGWMVYLHSLENFITQGQGTPLTTPVKQGF